MGSPSSENSRDVDEDLHEVTFTQVLCVGTYEVTQDQFEQYLGYDPSAASSCGGGLVSGTEFDCNGDLALDNGALLDDAAWYCGNATGPNPVGLLDPNAWGIHDVSGNDWDYVWSDLGLGLARSVQ
jgi:formylglycine-generating enzyme required for sulfatase activity